VRSTVEYGKLRQSLVTTTGRMWKRYRNEWEERMEKETKKYKFLYHGFDKGPMFTITDKETEKQYIVEAYDDKFWTGEKVCWGVYYK